MLDVTPRQVVAIADIVCRNLSPPLAALSIGMGIFKVDWDCRSIPWKNEAAAGRHAPSGARSMSYGDRTLTWQRPPGTPFVFAAQRRSSIRRGTHRKHIGWAYCHVPNGSTVDMTARSRHSRTASLPVFAI